VYFSATSLELRGDDNSLFGGGYFGNAHSEVEAKIFWWCYTLGDGVKYLCG
jgi:hypothetical protein